MEVILLERIATLGQMGDVVRVKDGFARNFLLPQGKALRASEASRKKFEAQRHELEARNLERKSEAEKVAAKVNGKTFVVVRQAGETGHLYGSVTNRDLAEVMDTAGFKVERSQIALNQPIKRIGLHEVVIALHPEVDSKVTINVARSEDEAVRQARGEDLTNTRRDEEEDEAPNAADVFEEGAAPQAEGEEAATDSEESAEA
jgi:large subunit ribosomal protein L9